MTYNEFLETENGQIFLTELSDNDYAKFLELFKERYGTAILNCKNVYAMTAWVKMHRQIFMLLNYQAENLKDTMPDINATTTIMTNDKIIDKSTNTIDTGTNKKISTIDIKNNDTMNTKSNAAGATNYYNIADEKRTGENITNADDDITTTKNTENTENINDKLTGQTDIIDVSKVYEFKLKENNLYVKILDKFLSAFFITIWYN